MRQGVQDDNVAWATAVHLLLQHTTCCLGHCSLLGILSKQTAAGVANDIEHV